MIVKIQQSQFTNADNAQMLVYNKCKKYLFEGDLTEDVKRLLNNRTKAYFYAKVVDGRIVIIKESEWQNW